MLAGTSSDEPLTTRATSTSEHDWLESPRMQALPPMDWGPPGLVVVIAPHPEDAILACGGTMRMLADAGHGVRLVDVTDGDLDELGAHRINEGKVALARLGLVDHIVVRLGLTDGHVEEQKSLASRLSTFLRGASWCIAPWEQDGNPDHDATGRAALTACAERLVRLARYPLSSWSSSSPTNPHFPWSLAHRSSIPGDVLLAKWRAIRTFRSETRTSTILPPDDLAHFERPFEVFFA